MVTDDLYPTQVMAQCACGQRFLCTSQYAETVTCKCNKCWAEETERKYQVKAERPSPEVITPLIVTVSFGD